MTPTPESCIWDELESPEAIESRRALNNTILNILFNDNTMTTQTPTLEPFVRPECVVAIYGHETKEIKCIGRTRTVKQTVLRDVIAYDSFEVAKEKVEESANMARQVGATRTYEVRPPKPSDVARLRATDIAAHLSEYIAHILTQEVENLAYCIDENDYYDSKIHEEILAAVKDTLDLSLNPEDNDPISMGWVGANGLP